MKILKKLSEKLSLTKTEIKVYLFLAVVIVAGSSIKFLLKSDKKPLISNESNVKTAGSDLPVEKGDIDYKQEVLDFKKPDFSMDSKTIPDENSINLNTAGFDELITLPGIGANTAQNIIEYRKLNGRFNTIDELENVKGIGRIKIQQVEKFIFID